MKLISENILFFTVLTSVWLILLAFCALIGILIVPVDATKNSEIVTILISGSKVVISLALVGIWLIGWYKTIDFLLQFELFTASLARNSSETLSEQGELI